MLYTDIVNLKKRSTFCFLTMKGAMNAVIELRGSVPPSRFRTTEVEYTQSPKEAALFCFYKTRNAKLIELAPEEGLVRFRTLHFSLTELDFACRKLGTTGPPLR